MDDLHQLTKIRREKLAALQQDGHDPFALTSYDASHHSGEIKERFDELEGQDVSLAGRLMA
ncbi:MAG: lysine--tRNA ligase, partial [Lachnospiraceae bacterium]|nr:lysine--tRNA ligase [Lachnospiraceae bacterium]